jgi:hypothetical protein
MTTFSIPTPQTPLIDTNTGLVTREWYKFLGLLITAVGGNTNTIQDVTIELNLDVSSAPFQPPADRIVDPDYLRPREELGELMAAANLGYKIVSAGTATLVAGTVTVNSPYAQTANLYIFTVQVPGGTQGYLSVGTITPGVSFEIDSTDATETSDVGWVILAPF